MVEIQKHKGHNNRGTLDKNHLPAEFKSPAPLRSHRLVAGALFLLIGSFGLIFTSYWPVSVLAAMLGSILLISYALVKKSLESVNETSFSDFPLTDTLKTHKHGLAQTKYLRNVSSLGERAHGQIQELADKYQLLNRLLRDKFSPTELSFERYSTAITDTTLRLLENFRHLQQKLNFMDTVDLKLASDERQTKLNESEAEVEEIFSFNESALKQMDELASSLNLVNSGGSLNSSLEYSLEELKRLTEQAKKYSR